MDFLNQLNDMQKKAVEDHKNPLLVLAGAGSGKTRVITYKIAHLVQNYICPADNIIAMTFTNKAANEMKERIEKILGYPIHRMWVGTFHSICARILRFEAENFGFSRQFVIYDDKDQQTLVKNIIKELDIDIERFTPKKILNKISSLKNKLIGEVKFAETATDFFDKTTSRIYTHYQKALRGNNAMDFDDLMMLAYINLEKHPHILKKYHNRFRYMLVDEFQDTNKTQFELIKLLCRDMKSITVVGDDDQSIYSWRGANIENILNFEKDFTDTKIIKLEQNYRSTQTILNTANHLIENNKQRYDKKLWSDKEEGEKLRLSTFESDKSEAYETLQSIISLQGKHAYKYNDFTILYRTNAQSRLFEEAFRNYGIPYVLVGAFKFFDRKEVKDVLSYVRLFYNPHDNLSFERAIQTPKRGLGKVTLTKLRNYAIMNREHEDEFSLLNSIKKLSDNNDTVKILNASQIKKLMSFYNFFDELRNSAENMNVGDIIKALCYDSGYAGQYKKTDPQDIERLENIEEFVNFAYEFVERGDPPTLEKFVEEAALLADIDNTDFNSNAVRMMTIHNSKGLEFPVVYITGLENGLFPHAMCLETNAQLEEERRLFYVAITRAQERVNISYAKQRAKFGNFYNTIPSKFLQELPMNLVESTLNQASTGRSFLQPGLSHLEVKGVNKGIEKKISDFNNSYYSSTPSSTTPKQVKTEKEKNAAGFKVGMIVKNPFWGVGKILQIENISQGMKLTINFDSVGNKKVLAKFAKLEIVG